MPTESWIDLRLFSFADVVCMTGYAPSRIHGFVIRKQFRPQYPQPHGGGRGAERCTYTARDILHLQLLGPLVKFGVHLSAGDRYGGNRQTLAAITHELDTVVDRKVLSDSAQPKERLVFPRDFAPWCYLVLDLEKLAAIHCKRIAEYRRLRDEGVELAVAARDSLVAACAFGQGS